MPFGIQSPRVHGIGVRLQLHGGRVITFSVVKERYGWAVRTGECMTTPFWSRAVAIREAHCLADSLRRHGQVAHVIIEGAPPQDDTGLGEGSRSFQPDYPGSGRPGDIQ